LFVNLLDILLIVIVAASVAAGWYAGFARAAIGFIAVLGGILFGFWFYGIPAAWLRTFLKSETASSILGFVFVFFAFQLAGGIAGKILSKIFKWTGLSFIDRICGAAFGLVRGALGAVAFVAVLMAFTPRPMPNWMVGSAVLPYAIDAADICAAIAPRELKDAYRKSMSEIRKLWDDQMKRAGQYRNKVIEPKPEPAPPPEQEPRPAPRPQPKRQKLKVVEQ
jgi:membrane protein required for colicin V production